jgi:hypothetical protein
LGLGALLLLNTLLAQGSFTLHTLNDRVSGLVDREQALQQRASELAAPQRLARRAQRFGMVASHNPAFLRADDGKILGEPEPAAAQIEPSPVVGSTDPAPGTDVTDTQGNGAPAKTDQATNDRGQNDQGQNDQAKGNGGQDGGGDR